MNRLRDSSDICSDATEDHYLVADPEDCHKFYSCVSDGTGFVAHHFTCPSNLAFDATLKRLINQIYFIAHLFCSKIIVFLNLWFPHPSGGNPLSLLHLGPGGA